MHRVLRRLVVGSVLLVGCGKPTTAPTPPDSPGPSPITPSGAPVSDYAERTKRLMAAAEKGQVSLLLELIQKGANPNDKDDAGDTALHKAAAAGQRSAVAVLLVKGSDPAERDANGRTPAMRAAEAGHAEVLTILLDPQKVTTLAGDVLKGVSAEAAKVLGGDAANAVINRLYEGVGATQDATDALGQTALMKAAANGHLDCVRVYVGNTHRLYALNARDKEGRSALMLAARAGHTATVEALVDHDGRQKLTRADLSQSDRDGKTAEQLADAGGHKPAAAAVRKAVLCAAAREGDVAFVCDRLAAAADVPGELVVLAAAEGGSAGVIRFLMSQWKDKPAEEKLRLMGTGFPNDTRSGTALHRAIEVNSLPAAEALTDPGWWKDKAVLADYLGRKGYNGQTPLQWSEWAGFGINAKPEIAALLRKRLEEVKK